MNATVKRLLTGAPELSDADRAELAAGFIERLNREVDEDATAAWEREIQRRAAELDDGSIPAIPWPEARRMIMG